MKLGTLSLLLAAACAGIGGARAADPSCSRGILSGTGTACCPSYCNGCGGTACESRPGGYRMCCVSGVVASGRKCSSSEAPCAMGAAPAPAPAPAPSSQALSVRRVTHTAMHAGSGKSIFERNREYNTRLDTLLMYQNVNHLSWNWIKSYLDAGVRVNVVIEFMDSYPNLVDIAAGKYDRLLRAFADDAKKDGRHISIRILHEFDSTWYNWSVYRGGSNSISNFKRAFRHVIGIFKGKGLNAKYQLAYNSDTIPLSKASIPRSEYYPGDDVVDEICVSAYNFAGVDRWHDRVESIAEVISPWYNAMSFNKKPLCISEMSSTNFRDTKAAWIRDTWATLARKFPRITTVTFFLENKGSHDFDLNSSAQETAFRDGFYDFVSATRPAAADMLPSSSDALPDEPPAEAGPSASFDLVQPLTDASEVLEAQAIAAEHKYFADLSALGLRLAERTLA